MDNREIIKSIALLLIIIILIGFCIAHRYRAELPEMTSTLHSSTECSKDVSSTVDCKSQTTVTESQTTVTVVDKTSTTTTTTNTSDVEAELIASVVMNEAGYESYEGKIAVAQCIRNAMIREGKQFSEIRYKYGYTTTKSPNRDSIQAVEDVFYNGVTVTDEPIMFYYAPAYCYSAWHESQSYVMTIGGHRFFKLKG